MHDHARDLASVLETDPLPGSARVGALVHAVAPGRRLAAHGVLAHADVDHVGIIRRNGDRSNASHAETAVGDILPIAAGVVRLPEAAAGETGVVDERLQRDARDCDRSAAAIRADGAPAQCAEARGVEG